jgi:hypothetical protein
MLHKTPRWIVILLAKWLIKTMRTGYNSDMLLFVELKKYVEYPNWKWGTPYPQDLQWQKRQSEEQKIAATN